MEQREQLEHAAEMIRVMAAMIQDRHEDESIAKVLTLVARQVAAVARSMK